MHVRALLDGIVQQKQPKNELNLDIIDFVLDFGCPKIISLIAKKDFLDGVLNLLKSETNAGNGNSKKSNIFNTKMGQKIFK